MVPDFLKAVCGTKLVFLPPALIPLADLTVTLQFRSLGLRVPAPLDSAGGSLVIAPSGAEKVFVHPQRPKKAQTH